MLKIKKRTLTEYVMYVCVIAVGIMLDQLTKWLSVKYLEPIYPDSIPIIKNVFQLTYVENDGAAFGMLDNHRMLFMVPSVVMIVALSLYLFLGLAENKLYAVSVAMIISGGIGNMIDRIALGYVVDMLDFVLINFAVFNVADSFVCVGAGFLILALVLDLIKEFKLKRAKAKESGEAEE